MGKGARVRAQRAAAAAARENFEPPIAAGRELPVEVINARLADQAEQQNLREVLEPRIDGHVLVYQTAIDTLVRRHTEIAETMDFGMGTRTRWSAVWELAGRCLALSNCLLAQIRAGFASESVPTMRAIHEAGQLLTVMAGPGEEQLLARWLSSEDIGVQQARSAEHRISKPYRQELERMGIELDGDQHKLSQQVYELLSAPAHSMRKGFLESWSSDLLRFAYGPHPDWRQRAIHAEFAGQQVVEVVQRIGGAFSVRFLGADFYRETIQRMTAEFAAIDETMPLDPETVRSLNV